MLFGHRAQSKNNPTAGQLVKIYKFPKRAPSNMEVRFGTLRVTNFHVTCSICSVDATFSVVDNPHDPRSQGRALCLSPYSPQHTVRFIIFMYLQLFIDAFVEGFSFLTSCDDSSAATDVRCFLCLGSVLFLEPVIEVDQYLSQKG